MGVKREWAGHLLGLMFLGILIRWKGFTGTFFSHNPSVLGMEKNIGSKGLGQQQVHSLGPGQKKGGFPRYLG